jgi:DNA-binding XRE family transcriptional regulator
MTLRNLREARGLTQVELAHRAGVSRQLVGAVEAGRHLPRVDAALALAAALDVDVARLFGPTRRPVDILTGEPPPEGAAVRSGLVGDTPVTTAVGFAGDGWNVADAVIDRGRLCHLARLRHGLVVAGCEPGLRLLEQLLREGGMAAISVGASSVSARAALAAGRTHAAVVHGPGESQGGDDYARFGIARWRVGLAGAPDASSEWWSEALSGQVPVVQREPGAGVQHAFEAALAGHGMTFVAGPRVDGHVAAVSQTMIAGTPSVTIEPAAIAAGARFHALEVHTAELLVARDFVAEPAVAAALDTLASSRFQRRLEAVGGYDLGNCGVRVA